jgi:hypothetical protein
VRKYFRIYLETSGTLTGQWRISGAWLMWSAWISSFHPPLASGPLG